MVFDAINKRFSCKSCGLFLTRRVLARGLGDTVADEVDGIKPRHVLQLQEIDGMAFAFAKQSPFPGPIDWEDANWTFASPLADKLLTEAEGNVFDPHQAEARLGPY